MDAQAHVEGRSVRSRRQVLLWGLAGPVVAAMLVPGFAASSAYGLVADSTLPPLATTTTSVIAPVESPLPPPDLPAPVGDIASPLIETIVEAPATPGAEASPQPPPEGGNADKDPPPGDPGPGSPAPNGAGGGSAAPGDVASRPIVDPPARASTAAAGLDRPESVTPPPPALTEPAPSAELVRDAVADASTRQARRDRLVAPEHDRTMVVRSTDALADLLDRLELTPTEAARLVAPFPLLGRATFELRGDGSALFDATSRSAVLASFDGIVTVEPGAAVRLVTPSGTTFLYRGLELAPHVVDGRRVQKASVLGFTKGSFRYSIITPGGLLVDPMAYLDRWLAEAIEVANSFAVAPSASSRAVVLSRRQAAQADLLFAPKPAEAVTASSGGTDLGRLQTISTARNAGLAGLLLALSAFGAWGFRRWARARSRNEVVVAGWSIGDLAELADADEVMRKSA